jgi:hypothetical protein
MDDSYANNIVALAGGGQTGATLLQATNSRVVTVATAADSVMLPKAGAGEKYWVKNAAANSLNVFPSLGDGIDATVNGAFAVAAGKMACFVCMVNGTWDTLLSA